MDGMAIALACLAINVYFEAGGEPQEGQIAVAHVTLNRAKTTGKEVCTVVAEEFQFSWTNQSAAGHAIIRTPDGWHLSPSWARKIDRNSLTWKNIYAVSQAAFYTPDITKGATHFHTTEVSPTWNKRTDMKFVRKIGNHLFYRQEGATQ